MTAILGYILMLLGLIGAVVPIIPGGLLVWAGIFVWALGDKFERVGWPMLIVLGVIAIIAMVSDTLVTAVRGRGSGMSWRTIGGAIAGALVGGIFLSVLPVIGTIAGAIIGAALGVMLVEYSQKHDWALAWQAAKVYLGIVVISRLIDLGLCLLMIGIFVWRAFF